MSRNWGGVRAGAGRRRVPLAVRVREGSFDASRAGHRRALLEDELPAEFPEYLREWQALYRQAVAKGNLRWALSLAGTFRARVEAYNKARRKYERRKA
jgi:hypothetical protein